MDSKHFTHLHVHTDFSLLDGAITLDKYIKYGQKNNFKALAISDHGNIFGAVKFFNQAKKAGIKPILGIEAYFTEDVKIKKADNKYHHLILLVQNKQGYENLCKLISFSYKNGFYFKPRIDYQILEEYSQGLIATSACLGGHIPSLLMENRDQEANEKIDWFLKVFGPERFFLEVQPEDQADQKILNAKLFNVAQKKGVGLVATGDSHYINCEDKEAHEVMLAIQTHHLITDPDRFTFGDCNAYLRTQSEMLNIFNKHEEAVWNTGLIADRCNFDFETGKLFFPQFEVPEKFTQESYFAKLCRDGLNKLISDSRIDSKNIEQYNLRLEEEISLITKMGYIGYFLVVSDFIQWAKSQDIPVGPGRGSAAGSLVAWALQITDIDPIRYNLLFERFLNPERVSMPDIDIDFCIEGRDAVIQYVRDKYGHDKVCQIITFGTMMAKGVIKDVARALGFPFEESNALTDLVPDQLKITLETALEQEPKLKKIIEDDPRVAKLFDIAFKLEGITRHASKHAAGIVISPEVIDHVLPVYIPPKTDDLVTQYAMTELESLGFLKMDFLGLKNLTLIKDALNLIYKTRNIKIDINHIDLEDKKTFELICKGQTSGVFQLESDGLKDVLRRLQPEVFEDIIAVNALYRPGPLGSGMVEDFIQRRHGKQEIVYIFPELSSILKETYGVIVYQEQVMKIASAIAGYSLGEADILRRAMGKKKAEVMAEQRKLFMDRAIKNNFNETKAGELFDLMAYFAGYGFNKSHSAAYALIAYQTAYLKANFTPEFMACLISLDSSDAEKMAFYIQEAQDLNLKIIPPDINRSEANFTVNGQDIIFGLRGIKNVGTNAVEEIVSQRKENSYLDLFDFCRRVDLRVCNKRVIENLIYAGAFDSLPGNRAQQFDELPHIIELAIEKKKAEQTGQLGLFDAINNLDNPNNNPENNSDKNIKSDKSANIYAFKLKEDWPDSVKLEKEKEVTGIYVSGKPLDQYKNYINWLKPVSFKALLSSPTDSAESANNLKSVTCIGMLKSNKSIITKKGDKMAFLGVEDYSGQAEVVVFPKLYQKVEAMLSKYQAFIIIGEPEISSSKAKLKAQNIIPLDLIFEHQILRNLTLNIGSLLEENLENILKDIKYFSQAGTSLLEFDYSEKGKKLKLQAKSKIRITKELLELVTDKGLSPKLEI